MRDVETEASYAAKPASIKMQPRRLLSEAVRGEFLTVLSLSRTVELDTLPEDGQNMAYASSYTFFNELRVAPQEHPDQKDSYVGDEAQSKRRKLMDEFDIIS